MQHPTEITDARGGKKQLGYNGSGQLVSYTDCSGQSSSWRFDVWGALIASTNAQGHKEQHWRDEQGRVIRTRGADGRELRCPVRTVRQSFRAPNAPFFAFRTVVRTACYRLSSLSPLS